MKAKPAKILWRVKQTWGTVEIERIVVVRETEHLLFLDHGSFTAQIDKRSESKMRELFTTEKAAQAEINKRLLSKLKTAVSDCRSSLNRAKRYVKERELELKIAEKKLHSFLGYPKVKPNDIG